MEIQLDAEERAFIEDRVKTGSYPSAQEVIRAGLRSLKQQEDELDALRAMVRAGDEDVAAGRFTDFQNAEGLTRAIIARARTRGLE